MNLPLFSTSWKRLEAIGILRYINMWHYYYEVTYFPPGSSRVILPMRRSGSVLCAGNCTRTRKRLWHFELRILPVKIMMKLFINSTKKIELAASRLVDDALHRRWVKPPPPSKKLDPPLHIGYVPRERPPFSALNFRSGAYNFHKLPTNPFRSITILLSFGGFCRSGDHHIQNFFNFSPNVQSSSARAPARRVLAVPARLAFSRSRRDPGSLVPETRIFTLKTDQARSGAPHFHARPGARSGARAHFSLCRGTYLPKFEGEYPPPPPPPGGLIFWIVNLYHILFTLDKCKTSDRIGLYSHSYCFNDPPPPRRI